MYKLYMPVMNRKLSDKQKQSLLNQLRKSGVDTVFLIFYRIVKDDEMLRRESERFKENLEFLKSNGIDVGAWLVPTIGYGGPQGDYDNDREEELTRIVNTSGKKIMSAYCPLDEGFVNEFTKVIKTICALGVKQILFEDDFTLGGGKYSFDVGCCCDNHMREYRKRIGEDITIPELREKLFSGGANKYRDEWINLQAEVLKKFVLKIREEADTINSDVRIGLSANSSSYDMEYVPLPELAKLIAGKNKPLIRLTGAPYWKNALILATNIEAVRVQTLWCNDDIELLTEGDTYPRPRHWIPSAFLEGYDMVLRADGKSHGILKYMLDYNSGADYETGYVERHVLNKKHYEEIEKRFSGKEAVGLNVFEVMETFRNREFGEDISMDDFGERGYLPLMSQWLLSENSIPTTYGASDCASIAFGENIKYADEDILKNGVIIDAQAAKILMAKGIDVGIREYERIKAPGAEYFNSYDEYTICGIEKEGVFYKFTLDEKAELLSEFVETEVGLGTVPSDGIEMLSRFPACFYYENDAGQKFMVYSFVPNSVYVTTGWKSGLFRNYCRQRQLADGIKKLQNRPLPAMCFKNPELYILCKKDENSMAVGLWNFFADSVLDPVIELDCEYKEIDFYNCSGKLVGNKVILDNKIPAFDFAFFTVR